ncbi:MAG: DUF1343 domain-containing protein [Ignavibacteria bacterium]|nr:DUF1343 domain-containing protein [Ignavibacteria bacterium]
MKKNNFLKFILFLFFLSSNIFFLYCQNNLSLHQNFKTGSEVLLDSLHLLLNKRVALITNHSGVIKDGRHILDILISKGINIVRIFTPEHNFFADDENRNYYNGIEIISLYNKNKNIKDEYLRDVDILIYDIQDLGVRFYTYTSTLYFTMRDAFRNEITFILCDRPAIHNLNYISGFMLEPEFSSFVGSIPTPVCYGMTTGELGNYLKSLIDSDNKTLDLRIMKMQDYNRNIDYENLNFIWINPSPNIRSLESARLYPALCFLEGTNFSEGRGTEYPFTLFGAPFCDNDILLNELNKYNLPGVNFEKVEFIPTKDKYGSTPKYSNEKCLGIKINLKNFRQFEPMETAVAILLTLKNTQKDFKWINNNFIDKLAGSDKLRIMIDNHENYLTILNSWKNEVENFKNVISKFLLY